jgi:hypothetical protein
VDLGVRIRLAFFKPAHGLTPELVARYEANRLTVTRQLPYEPGTNKTLDLTLFVNGIPIATAEFKNALTGQGVEDAKEQYRKDLCRVRVKPSSCPVEAEVNKHGQHVKKRLFYGRFGNGTRVI